MSPFLVPPPAIVAPPPSLTVAFEVRERLERRVNPTFATDGDERSDALTRIRPSIEIRWNGRWAARAQFQFAHDAAWTPARNFSTENQDLREGFVRYAGSSGTVTVGRQKIVAGSERLIGMGEWTNVGRSFDSVRFQNARWDAFAGTIGVSRPRPRNAKIAALGYNWRAGKSLLVYKGDSVPAGNLSLYTLDHSHKWSKKNFDFAYEVAAQFGRNAGLDHRAWAAHFGLGYRPSTRDRFYLDLNAASGGPGTTRSETFDNLYPTNHKFYGSMDLQSWRNMREVSVGWNRKLDARTELHVHAHSFWLMDAKDAWYGASGAPNARVGGVFRDPTGASGKDVGWELDVEGTWSANASTTLQLGIAVFHPGSFIRRMNGGEAQRQTWLYFQVLRRF